MSARKQEVEFWFTTSIAIYLVALDIPLPLGELHKILLT